MRQEIYIIKKTLFKDGKKMHVFVTDEHSEVLEFRGKRNIADKFCNIMNENSDNGCHYEVIVTGSNG